MDFSFNWEVVAIILNSPGAGSLQALGWGFFSIFFPQRKVGAFKTLPRVGGNYHLFFLKWGGADFFFLPQGLAPGEQYIFAGGERILWRSRGAPC